MRDKKGNSLIQFPSSYVVVDIETTGLSPEYDSIIEICAMKYSDNVLTDSFSSLVNPGFPINDFISALTGITNDMLSSAPALDSVIPKFYDFVKDSVLVGHNVHFDLNFLYDACMEYLSLPLSNDFIDTLRISRRLHPENRHNRLSDLSEIYHIDYSNAHRAESDCLITNKIFQIFLEECVDKFGDIDKAISQLYPKPHTIKASDITTDKDDFDISHPLYGKVVVFTGALEKMPRQKAMQYVVDFGGVNGSSVTKSTNYLVLGNNDYCKSIKDGKSNKQKKAEEMKLDGYDIEVIPENVFYDMIGIFDTDRDPLDGKPATNEIFNDFELGVFRCVKDILVSSGRDVSRLRCMSISGNKFSVSYFYEIIRFKLRGEKSYYLIRSPRDLEKYNLPSFSESSEGRRYTIGCPEDLYAIKDLVLDLYDDIANSVASYEKNVKSSTKNIRDYLKNGYC